MLPTLQLAVTAMLVAICCSLPLGIISALHAGKPLDLLAMSLAMTGIAIPNFWLGPMLVLLFSIKLGWLPVSEQTSLSSYVLPAVTLGIALAAILSRMTRNSMLDHLHEDYARTARAKGVKESVVIFNGQSTDGSCLCYCRSSPQRQPLTGEVPAWFSA